MLLKILEKVVLVFEMSILLIVPVMAASLKIVNELPLEEYEISINKVLVVGADGKIEDIKEGLPGGLHENKEIWYLPEKARLDKDGKIIFKVRRKESNVGKVVFPERVSTEYSIPLEQAKNSILVFLGEEKIVVMGQYEDGENYKILFMKKALIREGNYL